MTDPVQTLSEREKDALRPLVHGHDAKSVARALDLSIHTVNERLRSARRKLGVSSSREAARLLAHAEQQSPKFLGHKPVGIAAEASPSESMSDRSRRPLFPRPLVLALGGTFVMSLILAAVVLAWSSANDLASARPAQWAQVTGLPSGPNVVRNVVRLDGNHLTWNGDPITEPDLSQFLDITTRMSPQPVIVLSYSAQTRSARIAAIRGLVEKVVQCTPSNCQEVSLKPAG